MRLIAIAYHSGYGYTAKQAEDLRVARSSFFGVTAALAKVAEVSRRWPNWRKPTPSSSTYMGSAWAPFRALVDSSSEIWPAQGWKDKPAAGFTNSAGQNGDKLSLLQQLAIFAAQHSVIWLGLGLPPGNHPRSHE